MLMRPAPAYASRPAVTSPARSSSSATRSQLGLSAVLGQGDGGQLAGQGPECSAGGELGELAVVPDQHQLPAGPGGDVQELGEVAGAEHAGLVDDQHPAGG